MLSKVRKNKEYRLRGWEGFVACEGNQVKVGGREAKHRAKEDEDLGLYL